MAIKSMQERLTNSDEVIFVKEKLISIEKVTCIDVNWHKYLKLQLSIQPASTFKS